jgi:hypothetical protein
MHVNFLSRATANRLGGLLSSAAIRLWMSTLDYRAACYDPAIDPAHSLNEGQKIYVFWHEYILFPFYLRGHCNLSMLVSQHRDADILFEAAKLLGFDLVRGSSFRGGSTALRELLRKSESLNIAITHLLGEQARSASGADGLWLRPAVANEDLGPLCHSASLFKGARCPGSRNISTSRIGPGRYRAQSSAGRANAQPTDT